ncbi:hypothetical protein GA0115259_109406, partial [Streptomyces sp. MnatMP-M17]
MRDTSGEPTIRNDDERDVRDVPDTTESTAAAGGSDAAGPGPEASAGMTGADAGTGTDAAGPEVGPADANAAD